MATKTYSAEEVAKHDTKKDLWVSIHGKVYNLTPYIEDHPGGFEVLTEAAGQDATNAFEDLGHGADARDIMERFRVGVLDQYDEDQTQKVKRNIKPVEVIARGGLPSAATLAIVAELLSTSVIVMLGFVLMKRFGRFASVHHWSIPSAVTNVLPWATATSLASYLITRITRRAFPHEIQAKLPPHFKPKNMVAHPKEDDYAVLDPRRYIELPITTVEPLSSNSNKIIVDLPSPNSVLGLPVGQHISIRTLIDDKPVARSYTPTSSNKDRGRLELVIKNYDDGLLTGNYLKNVKVGDKISISGPRGQMRYRRGLADNIGMIAGGTGITPMFQLIRSICEDPRDHTNVQLIYGNQKQTDILLKAELDAFARKHSDQFSVHYMLSHPESSWQGGCGRCDQKLVEKLFASPENKKNKAMICGPPGLVDGAKEWLVNLGYDQPNAVSKIHDQVFVF